jgi:hypothetical protein
MHNFAVDISGTSSKVFDLVSDTGNEAVEIHDVNFNDCTSLGTLDNYRQGLETGNGRFGGTPDLTLKGVWNGYRVSTSIVRSLDNSMTPALFVAGTGFTIDSRFLTDINCDLGNTAPFADFTPSNFTNSSSFRLFDTVITRSGALDPTDATILPNITNADTESYFKNNEGIENTFVGGQLTITSTATTTVSASSTYYDILGTWGTSDLEHFDEPSNGQLRHLGNTPRQYQLIAILSLDGTANDVLKVNVRKYDSSSASFSDEYQLERKINNLAGSRDIAAFTIITNVTLDENDYIILQVSNETAARDIVAEVDSYFIIKER